LSIAESNVSTSDIESDISDCMSVWCVENESKVEIVEVGCSRNSVLDDTESDLDDLSSLSMSSVEDSSCSLWEVTRLSDDDEVDDADTAADGAGVDVDYDDDDESDSDVSCCTVYHLTDTDSYVIVDMVPKC